MVLKGLPKWNKNSGKTDCWSLGKKNQMVCISRLWTSSAVGEFGPLSKFGSGLDMVFALGNRNLCVSLDQKTKGWQETPIARLKWFLRRLNQSRAQASKGKEWKVVHSKVRFAAIFNRFPLSFFQDPLFLKLGADFLSRKEMVGNLLVSWPNTEDFNRSARRSFRSSFHDLIILSARIPFQAIPLVSIMSFLVRFPQRFQTLYRDSEFFHCAWKADSRFLDSLVEVVAHLPASGIEDWKLRKEGKPNGQACFGILGLLKIDWW